MGSAGAPTLARHTPIIGTWPWRGAHNMGLNLHETCTYNFEKLLPNRLCIIEKFTLA